MNLKRNWFVLLIALVCCPLPVLTADEENPPIPLLMQEQVRQTVPPKPGAAPQNLAPLTDGKTDQMLEIQLQAGISLDVLYHLPAVATCQELVISADTRKLSKKQLPRIEVLVSTLSDQAGFQSTRSLALKATADPQQLKIPPVAARWVIVRIASPLESITLHIAEIDIQGYQGVPQTRYAFKEAPAKAFEVLAAVQKSVAVKISKDEANLFQDTADGKLDDWSLAEAALLSSGIVDAEKRKQYLAQIDRLTEQANVAVKNSKTPYEKGELLLKWLHAHPMSNGYESHQTDLAVILDTKKFNCVSSATLFNIIGRRLALDVRAIEVPDHAFSIQYVGTQHADVETTNAAGFNPARDPRVLKQFTQQTGFNYIPDRHADKRREVTNIGLLALTCYNHGVFHSDKNQHAEALVDFFRALNLDPEFPSAIQAVVGTLGNWSGELIAQDNFEQALEVISVGLRLAPEDNQFRHNQKIVWQSWAITEIKNNRRQQGLEIFKRAAKALPKAGFEEMQAFAFTYPGNKLVDAKQWDAALELATEGLKTLPPAAQKELHQWRNSLYNRWTLVTLDRKDYPAAAKILEEAMMADPKERDFTSNTAFLVQEWLASTNAKQGLAEAESLITKLGNRFSSVDNVNSVIETFLHRATITLLKTDQFQQASDLVDRHQKQLSERSFHDLHRGVYEEQAEKLRNQKKWEETIALYTSGLKKLPKDRHLTQNLVATWHQWAISHQKANDWSAAANVYLKAFDTGIDNREFANRVGYCVQELAVRSWKTDGPEAAEKILAKWIARQPDLSPVREAAAFYVQNVMKKHQQDKQPAKALEAINRCRKLLTDKDHALYLHIVCDNWAASHEKKSEWEKALAVYALGFKSLPKDRHLTRNLMATWHRWAISHQKANDWSAAANVYLKALDTGIDDREFANRVGYCVQELAVRSLKTDGPDATEKLLVEWIAKRPKLDKIRDAAYNYVYTVTKKHQQEKQPAKALETIDRCRKLLRDKDHALFIRIVCDDWASSHKKKSEWDKALAIYALGFKSLPKDRHLTQNASNIWNQQGLLLIKEKKWDAAIKVYEQGLKQFPNASTLRNNLKYCQQQADK